MVKTVIAMIKNEALNSIIAYVLDHQMGKAISELENYLYTTAQPRAVEQLEQLKADYRLMADYWQAGFSDPQRAVVYGQLLRRMYVLATNEYFRYYVRNSSFVQDVYNRTRASRNDWAPSSLCSQLESFVQDVAMLELEPDHIRMQKQVEVYDRHLSLMSDLFDYIWTSRLWTDGVTAAFEDMLLSPTIDSNDQQMMVSAITLSALNFFGINKFSLLVRVYMKSSDEHVRQRALTGWVLCLNSEVSRLYTEMYDLVKQVTEDERCLDELAELQIQMIYCLRAESDNHIIQSEIMPELLKNNNLRVTRNGVEEVEDDPMEDILHPELSEQRMEKLESGMRRMLDMQKQGSDIYFGGFSQMKRFPFFQTVGNWFVPYMPQHPVVRGVLTAARGRKFLQAVLSSGPFCDSDKYSFLLAYETVQNKLPESLLAMLDKGEATLAGGELAPEELQSPAYLRRIYLQNLYRFFRVSPHRGDFFNPFESQDTPRYLFFANPLFRGTRLEEKFGQVVAFFVKQQAYDAAKATLRNYSEGIRDAQFYLLNGHVLMRTHDSENAGLTATESYYRVLELQPDNERAWSGYARASFGNGDYDQALRYYRKLLERHQENQTYQMNVAVCLTNMGKHEEALKMLYKLNYELPDDKNVSRVLAWALVGAKKYELAGNIYAQLLAADERTADDLLNGAYHHWFSGDVAGAVALFREYAGQEGVTFNAAKEFLDNEADTIRSHGVSEVEVRLMIDQLL